MIIRKLDYLTIGDTLQKAETEILENEKIGVVFAPNHGFVLYGNNGKDNSNIFIIKTKTEPSDYVGEKLDKKLEKNKKEFISIIDIF